MFFQHHKPELFYRLSTIFTLIAGAIFLISSAGWIFNVSPLFYVDSGWSPIKPACSISGLMLAFSNLLILRRRSLNWLNYFLAIVPLLLAAISITENLSKADRIFLVYDAGKTLFINPGPLAGNQLLKMKQFLPWQIMAEEVYNKNK